VFIDFCDPKIASATRHLLNTILRLVNVETLLNFESQISRIGEKSFHDFYTKLCVKYSECSYGDWTFSVVILLPTAAGYSSSYRLTLFTEYVHCLRLIPVQPDENIFITKMLLSSYETSLRMIRLYIQTLMSKTILADRNQLLYFIMVLQGSIFYLVSCEIRNEIFVLCYLL